MNTIYPYYNTPKIGKLIKINNELAIVTSHDNTCTITDDDASRYGSHLLGHEGSKGRAVTYRPATTEETAKVNAATALRDAAITARDALTEISYRVLGAQDASYLLGNGGFEYSTASYADDELNASIRTYQTAIKALRNH